MAHYLQIKVFCKTRFVNTESVFPIQQNLVISNLFSEMKDHGLHYSQKVKNDKISKA